MKIHQRNLRIVTLTDKISQELYRISIKFLKELLAEFGTVVTGLKKNTGTFQYLKKKNVVPTT